ncbi:hypothetical protein [Candidatus Tisiphia endosymbiont of Hybos culiciformis]|uniref:hypothetical protein n=1 Tax=Candidatus Tisiphia endosymbiont of Hybos culiciformis TaxID=3139331 RepID=UPI003CCABB92
MIKNITIVSCHSREGGNLDTCFRRYDTKFVSPNSIGFTIYVNTLDLFRNSTFAGDLYVIPALESQLSKVIR